MFDAKKETKRMVEFIRTYFEENNLGGVVLGISGGKDSGVVAGLFTEALGKDKVLGVTMPCHSKSEDKSDAQLVSDYYGFELINMDLTNVFDSFKDEVVKLGDFNEEELKNSDINLKPRMRMMTLYYLAALYTSLKGKTYVVAGTSNKCELYVGYFTKGGDSVHDISVLADLTVDEVIEVGKCLGVPDKVLFKKPNDGLSNMSDEEKLGVTYKDIATFMEKGSLEDKVVEAKIKDLHKKNLHKFNIATYKKGS